MEMFAKYVIVVKRYLFECCINDYLKWDLLLINIMSFIHCLMKEEKFIGD